MIKDQILTHNVTLEVTFPLQICFSISNFSLEIPAYLFSFLIAFLTSVGFYLIFIKPGK